MFVSTTLWAGCYLRANGAGFIHFFVLNFNSFVKEKFAAQANYPSNRVKQPSKIKLRPQ